MDDELENVINLLNDSSFKKHFNSSGKKSDSGKKSEPRAPGEQAPERKRPVPFSRPHSLLTAGLNENSRRQSVSEMPEDEDAGEEEEQQLQQQQYCEEEEKRTAEVAGRGLITKPRRTGSKHLPPQFPRQSKHASISEKQFQKREQTLKQLESAY